ncbi:hypothetical protein [Candidatus Thioglobus sp.]|uniref:hypothetical protein n=1 Tax=Candidatus Thioglobus sp. TaxID=2026721 RepID=UPI003D0B3F45
MNLWHIFPELILRSSVILYAPYLTAFFYVLVLLMLVKFKPQRAKLLLFVLVTIVTNIVIIMTLGPGMGNVLIPLLLLIIMGLPLLWLLPQCMAKNRKNIYIFAIVTIAGWVHSIGWAATIFALARS